MKCLPITSVVLVSLVGLADPASGQATPVARVSFQASGDLAAFNNFPASFDADFAIAVIDSSGNGALDPLWSANPLVSNADRFPFTSRLSTGFGRHIGSPFILSTMPPVLSGFCGEGATMVIAFKDVQRTNRLTDRYIFWLAFHENTAALGPACSVFPLDCGVATWTLDTVTNLGSNFHHASLVGDAATALTQHGPISLRWSPAGTMNSPGAILTADPANPAACLPGVLPSITTAEFFGAGLSHLRVNLQSIVMDVPYVTENAWNDTYFNNTGIGRTVCGMNTGQTIPAGNGGNPASRRLLLTKGIAVPGFGDNTILTPYDSQGTNWSYFIGGGESALGYSPAPDGTGRLLVGQVGSAGVWALSSSGAITRRVRMASLANFYPSSYQQQESFGHVLWTRSLPSSGLAEVWKVSNSGVTLTRRSYIRDGAGFVAETFQILPDGTGKLVWTDSAGHADVWTLDRAGNVLTRKAVAGPPLSQARSYEKLADGTARILWSRSINGSGYAVSTLDRNDNAVSRTPETRMPSLTWAASLSMN